jgi:hypothetical protein
MDNVQYNICFYMCVCSLCNDAQVTEAYGVER